MSSPYAAPVQVQVTLPNWARRKLPYSLQYLLTRILAAATRLETSTSIALSLSRLRQWRPTRGERVKYILLSMLAFASLYVMKVPGFPLKLGLPAIYVLAILLPISSQFVLPATPIFAWLLFFYSSQFIDPASRPHIWVSVLPTLETIWYGASISDILTRFGHPALDILAWLPYGVVHFVAPFVVAACLFVFAPPGATKVFGSAFGFLNVFGVLAQVGFPCAPPWYELREGLTPANYGMKGSPAGLARIDALFGGHGYTLTFTNAPVPFGAFPSLHAGCATMEALFLSYFFPVALSLPLPGGKRLRFDARVLYWTYAFWLYWCTMYLMHHYLVDLVGGACLATICFYFFLTDEMRVAMEQNYAFKPSSAAPVSALPAATVPRDGFGMRPSLDAARTGVEATASRPELVRPPSRASGVRLGGATGGDIKLDDLISRAKSPQPPAPSSEGEQQQQRHVLFEANVEEGNDWDDDDDPKATPAAGAGKGAQVGE